jgi:septal ring factor EnvC (AmiA/AmiB activator)
MSSSRRDDELSNIPQELIDLGKSISALPVELSPEVSESYARVVQAVQRRKRILKQIQDSLSQVRLDVKYLMFDLETTRAERDELRSELHESRKN